MHAMVAVATRSAKRSPTEHRFVIEHTESIDDKALMDGQRSWLLLESSEAHRFAETQR